MIRNLMVTGVVSVVMALATLAFRSLAPQKGQANMDGLSPIAADGQPSPMSGQQTPQTATGALTGQPSGVASNSSQPGGMMRAGQSGGGMMMCPCMQMMMNGGTMDSQTNGATAATQPLWNPRTKEQARQRAQQHLDSLGNPNLQVGEVRETAASYEVEVVTQDTSLVSRLIIDKQSGEIKTQY